MSSRMKGYLGVGLVCIGYWMLDSVWSYLSFEHNLKKLIFSEPGSYLDTFLLKVPPYQVVSRLMVITLFIIIGGLVIEFIIRQQAAQKQIRESEERFKTLFNYSNDGILLVDAETKKFEMCNEKICEMLGFSSDELTCRSVLDIHPQEDLPEILDAFDQLLTQESSPNEIPVLRKDGTIFYATVSSSPITLNDRQFLLGSFRDNTERRQAEKKLEKSEEKYRLLVENQTDVVVKVDPEGRFLFVSPSYCRMFGKSEQALLGTTFTPLVHEADREPAFKAMETLFTPPYTAYLEQRAMTRTGWRWLAWINTAVFDDDGNLSEVIGVGRDITDQKHSEEAREKIENQLRQAQKMESVGRLAGGVAHDFNNMLSIILGNTEIILEEVEPTHPLTHHIHEIRKAGRRSADLTRQLLAFARKQTVSPKVLDLNQTIEGMIQMLKRLIGEDIKLSWHPKADLWPVNMDPTQIDQILANLCVNARDAIVDIGEITIETDNFQQGEDDDHNPMKMDPGKYVRVRFSDNGCGMDRETSENLFEPFYTTKGLGEGTGLGLAMVYGIVKQNNGYINVYSEPDRGTTFNLYFPGYTAGIQSEAHRLKKEGFRSGSETILLVEDETAILEMIEKMLKRFGYTVLPAATPEDAIRIGNSYDGKIHLLMTDVVMPDMNGRDLAENLLKIRPDMKYFFMSGYTSNVIAHRGILDKGVHFLSKPFSHQELSDKLREILDA